MTEFKPGDIVRMRGDPDNPIMLVEHVCAAGEGDRPVMRRAFRGKNSSGD